MNIVKEPPLRGKITVFLVIATAAVLFTANGSVCATFPVPAPGGIGNVDELIDAIQAANTTPVKDTIVLEAGTYTLTQRTFNANGDNGLPSITSLIDIEVADNGEATIIRSNAAATPEFRIFHVGAEGALSLKNITIQNGYAAPRSPGSACVDNGCGGGIFNLGKLMLNKSRVIENMAALSRDGDPPCVNRCSGGGISNIGGNLKVIDSVIIENIAFNDGGGIASNIDPLRPSQQGTVEITRSEILINTAGQDGGGIESEATKTTITRSIIGSNEAGEDSGGIENDTGTLEVIDSIIKNNRSGDSGGGIQNNRGELLVVTRSAIVNNFAESFGGGIDNRNEDDLGSTATVTNSTIVNNSAGEGGGGVSNRDRREDVDVGNPGVSMTLNNVVLADNDAGGGIFHRGP
jgi:hypothetical protein